MPANGDKIRTTFISELAGSAFDNTLYWEVLDIGDDPPIAATLTAIATAYWDSVKDNLSVPSSLTCAVYENQSQSEGTVRTFPAGLVGTDLGTAHPQNQVVRTVLYGTTGVGSPVTVGAHNLSGVVESLSTRGRINDIALFDPQEAFFRVPLVIGTGWTLSPVIRSTTAKGFHDGGNNSATLQVQPGTFVADELIGLQLSNRNDRSKTIVTANTDQVVTGVLAGGKDNNWDLNDQYGIQKAGVFWPNVNQAIVNATFLKLRGRTTKLCATF